MKRNFLFSVLIILSFGNCTPTDPLNNQNNTNSNHWSKLGISNTNRFNGSIHCINIDRYNNIYIGGEFTGSFSGPFVAKWNGSDWTELGIIPGQPEPFHSVKINSIVLDSFNNIFVGNGYKTNNNGTWYCYIPKWNGINWTDELLSNSDFSTCGSDLQLAINLNGNLIIKPDNAITLGYLCKWDGNSWSTFAQNGFPSEGLLNNIAFDNVGNLYLSDVINTNGYHYVDKWDGTNWSEVGGTNTSVFNEFISSMVINKNTGHIFIAGGFSNQYGNLYVAEWDGTNWSEVGGRNSNIFGNFIGVGIVSLAIDNNGNIYASSLSNKGYFQLYKWNGTEWSCLGGKFNDQINCITFDSNNNVYVAGDFTDENGHHYVAVYNQ